MIALTLILLSVSQFPTQGQIYPLGPGIYDQDIPMIYYSGITWTITNDANNFGGGRRGTGITTSTAPLITFSIWGDGFDIFITRVSAGGTGEICINTTNCTTVSWYAPSATYTTVSFLGLGYGTHHVTIQKTSTTSDAINLDAVYVYPPTIPPTTIPPIVVVTLIMPTPVDTQVFNIGNWAEATIEVEITEDPIRTSWDIDGQYVAFEYRIDTGQVVMTIIQIIMLFIFLIILVLFLRGKQAS